LLVNPAAGKLVAAVCHGLGVLRRVKGPDGLPLVKGKSVTSFSNTEEAAIGLTHAQGKWRPLFEG